MLVHTIAELNVYRHIKGYSNMYLFRSSYRCCECIYVNERYRFI